MTELEKLKKINKENTPPDGWKAADAVSKAINWDKLKDPEVLKQLDKICLNNCIINYFKANDKLIIADTTQILGFVKGFAGVHLSN